MTRDGSEHLTMNLNNIAAGTIAMLAAGAFLGGVGIYTDNGGLQLAGALIFLAGLLLAIEQAGGRADDT